MPYEVVTGATGCDGYAVVKVGETVPIPGGCHGSKAEADAHAAAANIATQNEPRAVTDVDLALPQYIKDAAARGIDLYEAGNGGEGLTPGTIRAARDMAAGRISWQKVIRANAWGARHEIDLEAPSNSDSNADGWPGNGAVAHYLWGINPLNPEPARTWFARKAEQIQAERGAHPMTTEKRSLEDSQYSLTPHQFAEYEALEDLVEEYGKFDQGTVGNGAHYVAESPFAELNCSKCLFYAGPRGCEVVSGDIDPGGICKLWIIPEALIATTIEIPAVDMPVDMVIEGAGASMDDGTDEERLVQRIAEVRKSAPRDNLIRQVEFRAVADGDGFTLEGYAAVFGEWTDIDSYEGVFKERIQRGAFKKTISERMPVLQFDHGTHPLIGSIPLGVVTSLREDAHGLKVTARLSDNWLVEPVRDAIRSGAISGMSFKFRVIQDDWTMPRGKTVPERTIKEVALYELGPVVFPAYEQTTVGVRSREILEALTDPSVRADMARALIGTGDEPAVDATSTEPPVVALERTRSQRRAMLALRNIP